MEELIRKMVAGGLNVSLAFGDRYVRVNVEGDQGSQVSSTVIVPEGGDHVAVVTDWLKLIDSRTKAVE